MKRLLLFLTALAIAATSSAQYSPNSGKRLQDRQDSTSLSFSYDYYAMQDLSKDLNDAGKHIIESVVFGGIATASFIFGNELLSKDKNSGAGRLLQITSIGSAIVGVVLFLNAGVDLKSASKKANKIHPIYGGVSIDLN